MSRLEELLRRIGGGDQAAAAEFYSEYQPHVRKVIRARMRAAGLTSRRLSDSSDLCQIVLARFLVSSAVGRYELAEPDAARALLAKMAARRVVDQVRRLKARGPAPEGGVGAGGFEPVAQDSSPASQVVLVELIEKAEQRLTDHERTIAGLRKDGLGWDEIGHRLGKKGDAVRKTIERATHRILRELGMEESDDE